MNKGEMIFFITRALSNKKCQNIVGIDVSAKTDVTEMYLLCSARNPSQAKAAYEEICAVLEPLGEYTYGVDGLREGRWIVMDYGKIIVHIFHAGVRDLYRFEELWGDADGANITHFDD